MKKKLQIGNEIPANKHARIQAIYKNHQAACVADGKKQKALDAAWRKKLESWSKQLTALDLKRRKTKLFDASLTKKNIARAQEDYYETYGERATEAEACDEIIGDAFFSIENAESWDD